MNQASFLCILLLWILSPRLSGQDNRYWDDKESNFRDEDHWSLSTNRTDGTIKIQVKYDCWDYQSGDGSWKGTWYIGFKLDGDAWHYHLYKEPEELVQIFPRGTGSENDWMNGPAKISETISERIKKTEDVTTINLNDRQQRAYNFYYLPENFNSDQTFKLAFRGVDQFWKNGKAFRPHAPTNLTASTHNCESVDLSWSAPDNVGGFHGRYAIYRDGVYIGHSERNSLTYSDFTAAPDPDASEITEYQYEVSYEVEITELDSYLRDEAGFDGYGNEGPRSGAATGHCPFKAEAPTDFTASEDQCGGINSLNWHFSNDPVDRFHILRGTSEGDLAIIHTLADPTARSYEDQPPEIDVDYYYQIAADIDTLENDFGLSEVVTGRATRIPAAPAEIGITENNGLEISWKNKSGNVKEFRLIRSNLNSGVQTTINVVQDPKPAIDDIISYLDADIEMCTEYRYELFAVNDCGVSESGGTVTSHVSPDLSSTFASFKASKGYFGSHVRLTWENNKANVLSYFKIWRKNLLEAGSDYELLEQVDHEAISWEDHTATAGVLYEYKIQGFGFCLDALLSTDDALTDIGFRIPFGVVTGNVSFSGGIAVESVEVSVQNTSGPTGHSISFDGTGSVSIANQADFQSDAFTVQMYVHPNDLSGSFNLIRHKDGDTGWRLYYNPAISSLLFEMKTTAGLRAVPVAGKLETDKFSQVTGVFCSDSIKLMVMVDGNIHYTTLENPGNRTKATNAMIIGENFKGILDEVRFFNHALEHDEVKRNYTMVLSPDEEGLVGYWRCEEGVGSRIYDCSKEGSRFREHHGTLNGGVAWSNTVPHVDDLAPRAYTDANGNYTLAYIPYEGVGSSFNLTPKYGIHQFDPAVRTLYIGEGASVHNEIDFTDISAFIVTGSVRYWDGLSYDETDPTLPVTEGPVAGIFIKLDGNYLVKEGLPVETDADGMFEVEVPIGKHLLSIEKDKHIFIMRRDGGGSGG